MKLPIKECPQFIAKIGENVTKEQMQEIILMVRLFDDGSEPNSSQKFDIKKALLEGIRMKRHSVKGRMIEIGGNRYCIPGIEEY